MPGRPSRKRRDLHTFLDVDRRRKPRAAFAAEPDAQRAARRVLTLTGRRYSVYPCPWAGCGAWHIRRCRLRPEDLVRPA